MRARVYRNLHQKCLSIQHKVDGRWKVRYYANYAVLRNVRFIVRQGGREQVLREKRKNVHAFVEGDGIAMGEVESHRTIRTIRYNPYEAPYFFDVLTREPVTGAYLVIVRPDSIVEVEA